MLDAQSVKSVSIIIEPCIGVLSLIWLLPPLAVINSNGSSALPKPNTRHSKPNSTTSVLSACAKVLMDGGFTSTMTTLQSVCVVFCAMIATAPLACSKINLNYWSLLPITCSIRQLVVAAPKPMINLLLTLLAIYFVLMAILWTATILYVYIAGAVLTVAQFIRNFRNRH